MRSILTPKTCFLCTATHITFSCSRIFLKKKKKISSPRFRQFLHSLPSRNIEHAQVPNIAGVVPDVSFQEPSTPKRCSGCGATFQTVDPGLAGYVPLSVIEVFSEGRIKTFKDSHVRLSDDSNPVGLEQRQLIESKPLTRTRVLFCQRCHQIQHYKHQRPVALDSIPNASAQFSAESQSSGITQQPITPSSTFMGLCAWPATSTEEFIERISATIRPRSVVLHLVDLMDFEASLVPELHEACRLRHVEILWAINKVDCLPARSWTSDKLLKWLRKLSKQMECTPIDRMALISAKTGFNFLRLEKLLHFCTNESKGRYIYVMGRANSGKSTFVNRFLHHIGYAHQGTVDLKQERGGVTQASSPGTTLDFVPFSLPRGYKLIDTPGVPSCHQLFALPDTPATDRCVFRSTVRPVQFRMRLGHTLSIGQLAYVKLVSGHSIVITVFVSTKLPLQLLHALPNDRVTPSQSASVHAVTVYAHDDTAPLDDISIAGLGWITVGPGGVDGERTFHVHVPNGVHVFRRPALPLDWRKRYTVINEPSDTLTFGDELVLGCGASVQTLWALHNGGGMHRSNVAQPTTISCTSEQEAYIARLNNGLLSSLFNNQYATLTLPRCCRHMCSFPPPVMCGSHAPKTDLVGKSEFLCKFEGTLRFRIARRSFIHSRHVRSSKWETYKHNHTNTQSKSRTWSVCRCLARAATIILNYAVCNNRPWFHVEGGSWSLQVPQEPLRRFSAHSEPLMDNVKVPTL